MPARKLSRADVWLALVFVAVPWIIGLAPVYWHADDPTWDGPGAWYYALCLVLAGTLASGVRTARPAPMLTGTALGTAPFLVESQAPFAAWLLVPIGAALAVLAGCVLAHVAIRRPWLRGVGPR